MQQAPKTKRYLTAADNCASVRKRRHMWIERRLKQIQISPSRKTRRVRAANV